MSARPAAAEQHVLPQTAALPRKHIEKLSITSKGGILEVSKDF